MTATKRHRGVRAERNMLFETPMDFLFYLRCVSARSIGHKNQHSVFYTAFFLHIERWQLMAEAEVDWLFAQQADPCIVEAARGR